MGIIASDNLLAFDHLQGLFPSRFIPKDLETWTVTSAVFFIKASENLVYTCLLLVQYGLICNQGEEQCTQKNEPQGSSPDVDFLHKIPSWAVLDL